MTCTKCNYHFIFDPQKHYFGSLGAKKMTDGYFIKCLDQLSRNNTYYYTEDELYCFIAQKSKFTVVGCLLISLIFTGVISGAFHAVLDTSFWPALFILPLFIFLSFRSNKKTISRKRWNKFLAHWKKRTALSQSRDHYLAGLLNTPQLIDKPESQKEPDIYDYGASKLLICEHDIQVDWLIMNNFHTQNGIVIISEKGYPNYLTDQVQQLISNNPELEVYLLHNAGNSGEKMPQRINQPNSLFDLSQHQCLDLGIDHDQLMRSGLKKYIINQYKGNFPAHALNYHNFNRLLVHSITEGTTLGLALTALATDGDSGISCDFG